MQCQRMRVAGCWVLVAMLHAGTASAALRSQVGEARSPTDGRLLYEEHHLLRETATGPLARQVMYRCPDGRAFARKHVEYGPLAQAPGFRMDDARFGYAEGYSPSAGEAFVQRGGKAEIERGALKPSDDLVVDAGFDEFIRARWDSLQSGKPVDIRFLVPSRLTAYRFSVRKLRDEVIEGDAVSVFRLSLRGVLSWFVDSIDVAYRQSDRQLMRFEGLSNIRSRSDENLIARIDFPPARAQTTVDEAEWQRFEQETLHEDCQKPN